jgi:hypothetical protein
MNHLLLVQSNTFDAKLSTAFAMPKHKEIHIILWFNKRLTTLSCGAIDRA